MGERIDGDGRRMMTALEVPGGVLSVLRTLTSAGFEAVLVGGCVRDALMGVAPHDFDVASQAMPREATAVLEEAGFKVIPTGIKHGTVTAIAHGSHVEVTTYRIDGEYLDQRHCEVTFTRSLEEDLARRDFTINAMALMPAPTGGFALVDPFGGEDDLRRGLIRCVGDPARRFEEDPLRMLRAVRFAARFGFAIDRDTRDALYAALPDIDTVSLERKTVELVKTLAGPHAQEVLLDYRQVVFQVVPELADMDGFDQHSPWHAYDVWGHTARVVGSLERRDDAALLLAALLHDCAKPDTFTRDADGIGHFWGHDVAGEEKVRGIMRRRLRLSVAVADRVALLVRFHELRAYDERAMMRLARRVGERVTDDGEVFDVLEELLWLRRADIKGQRQDEHTAARLAQVDEGFASLARMRAEGASVHVKDLAIGGRDVIALGVPKGPEVGRVLRHLLDLVVAGKVPNEREALLRAVRMELSPGE